jgi:hypothetical protein
MPKHANAMLTGIAGPARVGFPCPSAPFCSSGENAMPVSMAVICSGMRVSEHWQLGPATCQSAKPGFVRP